MAGGKITQKEKEAAISLLITVFEMHNKESLFNKALDDFYVVMERKFQNGFNAYMSILQVVITMGYRCR